MNDALNSCLNTKLMKKYFIIGIIDKFYLNFIETFFNLITLKGCWKYGSPCWHCSSLLWRRLSKHCSRWPNRRPNCNISAKRSLFLHLNLVFSFYCYLLFVVQAIHKENSSHVNWSPKLVVYLYLFFKNRIINAVTIILFWFFWKIQLGNYLKGEISLSNRYDKRIDL